MAKYINKLGNDLLDFRSNKKNLKVVRRKAPSGSDFFFNKLIVSISTITGFVSFNNATKDIKKLMENQIPLKSTRDPFYNIWIDDVADICKLFCTFLGEEKISFWLGTHRGCKRYHVDMVPFRLLVTYLGQGTELLPNYAANRNAFINGEPNNHIIKDKSALKHIKKWDIAIFRGGNEGILHRTPNSALKDRSSLLMRLDNSRFLEDIININEVM